MLNYKSTATAAETAKKINAIQKYFIEASRLGIPIIAFDEVLHGLVRDGATAFPQAIALAASWDTSLMHRVATAIAKETKSRGIRQVLSPVINIADDVRWGRVEETYGEDPFLSSKMGVAYMKTLEDENIIATPKHFVANVGDGDGTKDRLRSVVHRTHFRGAEIRACGECRHRGPQQRDEKNTQQPTH